METFQRAESALTKWKEYLARVRKMGGDKEAARNSWDYFKRCEYWRSETYQVAIDKTPDHNFGPEIELWHLSFKRNDREAFHDWRVAQGIKNQLCGPETEGMEIYPAESRLVDTSNQYHMWVFVTPGFTIPCGFSDRVVITQDQMPEIAPNAKQRKFED
jgi:hypothetical protein